MSDNDRIFDLVVIGGGINGTGIAADAAGRGLSVLMAEADDLASGTSSASSKLIHGGLRYLEHFEFRLVREALGERERLMARAPHIIWPLRFVLPQVEGMRSELMLRAGLFLYDHLAPRRQLGASRTIDLRSDPAGAALKPQFRRGYSYFDCWVDDARLVVANALEAKARGAEILTRTPVTGVTSAGGTWFIRMGAAGAERTVKARVLVNAAGPWVGQVAGLALGQRNAPPPKLRLVKGSHIVVRRIGAGGDAYIFQNDDGRVVFALPFERDFTLIGTTDVACSGDARAVTASADEQDYLLALAGRFFAAPLSRADIVWSFAGVRPLDDDGASTASAVSRDYRLDLDMGSGPPVLHVIGGKVTTYRRLAEAALEHLQPYLPAMKGPWTEHAPLPGGDVGSGGFDAWFSDLTKRFSGIDAATLHRLARRYGTRTANLLGSARTLKDLGDDLGAGLTTQEVRFLRDTEWAETAEDVLWRRTKAGLHMSANDRVGVVSRIANVLNGP